MGSRKWLAIVAALSSAAALAQELPQIRERFLRMTEAEQIAYTNTAFDHGLTGDEAEELSVLIRIRSAVVLPVLERRTEELLNSVSSIDCFVDKTVDPGNVIDLAAEAMAYAGDEHALREIGKLLALSKLTESHERLYRLMMRSTLQAAEDFQNPFHVAYRGFDIGDPAVDDGIVVWVERQFEYKAEPRQEKLKYWWAEAMVEKYGHAPNEVDWANDPIATRIDSKLAWSMHDEIFRLGAEAAAAKKK
jgi:hypothetical protein